MPSFRRFSVVVSRYAARDGWGTMKLAEIRAAGTPVAEARFPLAPAPRNEVLVRWQESKET